MAALMDVELGTIEGFYGRPWTWEQRASAVAFLAPYGYRFYHYAPKADPFLRLRWRDDYPDATAESLRAFAAQCRTHGVRFGIGLSPVLHDGFDAAAKDALARKLAFFDDIGTDDVALLFDDMTGTTPDLAARQADVVHWASARTRASRLLMCPSYYTDDPVLDRVFGDRPVGYVEQLGRALDANVEIYWTGEEVCSRAFSPGHLARVAEQLQRKPFLWDNYPVNDGARMSQYIHVRGFTGRPASMAPMIAAHGVNPALQPTLHRIPAITLADSYRAGDAYEYQQAMRAASVSVLGETLGRLVHEDTLFLQDIGLDRLGEKEAVLRARYADVDHPAAREIIAWLDGDYRITDALIRQMAGNEQG